MNYEVNSLPKHCPKCGKKLSKEHLETLSQGFAVAAKLQGFVRQVKSSDFLCDECVDRRL